MINAKILTKYLKNLLVLYIFLLIPLKPYLLNAQEKYTAGARMAGISGCGSVIIDLWSNTYNQACLAYIEDISFGYYYENRFLEESMSLQALALALPVWNSVVGLNMIYFGNKNFFELKTGLAVAKIIYKNFSSAIQINIHTVHQPFYYDDASAISFEFGLLYKSDIFSAGIHMFNLTNSAYKQLYNTKLPFITEIGIGIKPIKKLLMTTEVEINNQYKPIFKGGLEYTVIDKVIARIGFSTYQYSGYSFGLGFIQKKIKANIAFSQHIYLGFTPHIDFIYSFSK